MAAGLPVVSTDVGGVREILGDPPVGYLAPAGDDRKLAEGIVQLGNNPELHRAWSEQGRRRAFDLFSEQTMHARYAEIFDSVLNPPWQSQRHSKAAMTQ